MIEEIARHQAIEGGVIHLTCVFQYKTSFIRRSGSFQLDNDCKHHSGNEKITRS